MKHSLPLLCLMVCSWLGFACSSPEPSYAQRAQAILADSVLEIARVNLGLRPETVTASRCVRSAGGAHDFYSEGDYWWPDSTNPEGPYVRRDGLTNPGNFTAHREALMRFSEIMGNLSSAFLLTDDPAYARAALAHSRAWFLTDSTRMNPHLLYAQAIKGRHTGRGIGIIDAIHFMEVVQALRVLDQHGQVPPADLTGYQQWFGDFLTWLTTHPYGLDEKVHPNNHGTCWNMQVALYARFTGNEAVLDMCRTHFSENLLPSQMAEDGSFPLELKRTKPYGYSLFNLDAMVMNALILSDPAHDLWNAESEGGKSIRKGLDYMRPYVADKTQWPLEPDVMYWDEWPVAHPAFLFGAMAYDAPAYYDVWAPYAHFPTVFEVKRNLPIRNPLIWLEELET
ncbi:MAG: alginate lyase [Bacteroidetes bacterium]|nr:MAG: alginate lyase [Bacteroidota bacterium]